MYTPLEFIEQMKRYIMVLGYPDGVVVNLNNKLSDNVEEYMSEGDNFGCFVYDYIYNIRRMEKIGKFPKKLQGKWGNLKEELAKSLGVPGLDTDGDFFNHLAILNVLNDWKYHKYTYKVEGDLGTMLTDMSVPKDIPLTYITNTPTRCFYIDTTRFGNSFCEDMEGFFVLTLVHNNTLLLLTIAMIRGINGRIMPIYSRLGCTLEVEGDEATAISFGSDLDTTEVTMEDGVTRVLDENKIFNFYANFILYLHASNKDVEESSVSKSNFRKPVEKKKSNIKNKFKEVRMYELGYRIVKPKNTSSNSTGHKGNGVGSKKSPHFRSAHWHHYWVGSKDDRKLVLKWVEGTFVGSKVESDVANVRYVK